MRRIGPRLLVLASLASLLHAPLSSAQPADDSARYWFLDRLSASDLVPADWELLRQNVLLALYEARVSAEFDRVEPLAADLAEQGRIPGQERALLKNIGAMLLIESRMVGRAEISEKPELLWEQPGLEGLFVRLQDEFEIRERHLALERKMNLLSHTAQSVQQLISARHSIRVEWYIVILIVFEIILTLYELFIRH